MISPRRVADGVRSVRYFLPACKPTQARASSYIEHFEVIFPIPGSQAAAYGYALMEAGVWSRCCGGQGKVQGKEVQLSVLKR